MRPALRTRPHRVPPLYLGTRCRRPPQPDSAVPRTRGPGRAARADHPPRTPACGQDPTDITAGCGLLVPRPGRSPGPTEWLSVLARAAPAVSPERNGSRPVAVPAFTLAPGAHGPPMHRPPSPTEAAALQHTPRRREQRLIERHRRRVCKIGRFRLEPLEAANAKPRPREPSPWPRMCEPPFSPPHPKPAGPAHGTTSHHHAGRAPTTELRSHASAHPERTRAPGPREARPPTRRGNRLSDSS